MKIPLYQVDAFASEVFEGNPAAVCPLQDWIPDKQMQQIAMENNLSETAFFVEQEDGFRLRWFTPTTEVDLCGHATLASAHVIFNHLGYSHPEIQFESNSGILKVAKEHDRLVMDFPSADLQEASTPDILEQAVGHPANEVYKDTDYLYLLENEQQVRDLEPDIPMLAEANARGIIVTAPSDEYDFVSRFFAPSAGVDEDPVTGSAHTMLAPYWSDRLDKQQVTGRQVSARGGIVYCSVSDDGNRVNISGHALTFLEGKIKL